MNRSQVVTLSEIIRMLTSPVCLHCIFFTLTFSFSISLAQNTVTTPSGFAPILPSASAASYYYIAKPGELTMLVNIWGYVQKPGRYEVPGTTDIIQLISYAGGPAEYADLEMVQIIRAVRVDNRITKRRYVLDLEKLERIPDDDLRLYPGDTVFLDSTGWVVTRDALVIVTAAALVVTAVSQVIIATTR